MTEEKAVTPLPDVTEDDLRREVAELEVGDFETPFDTWKMFRLPTGLFPYFVGELGGVFVAHIFFLMHGRVWTSRHDPSRLHLVGGSIPF